VGRILASHFHAKGHTVTVLSRDPRPAPWRMIRWDGVTPGAWVADVEHSDVCTNLAGRSVDCRYHAKNRWAIYDSRIRSTRLGRGPFTELDAGGGRPCGRGRIDS
jgi:NAD dependent epimerase/dehydratase family enzyme